MALPLPKFSTWKTLIKTPTQRKISGNTNKFKWTDLFKPIGDIIGFAFGGLKSFLSWSATAVAQLVIAAKRFIWYFNWNVPEENLLQAIEQQRIGWYSQFGSTVGQALGWISCGILPAAAVIYFNKPLGLQILEDVGEEAYDELVGELGILLQMSARIKINEWLIQSFVALRFLIKNAANKEADPITQTLADSFFVLFPKAKEAAKHWGDKGGKPFILANEVEELVENSPLSAEWKAFLEEAIDEFGDSCDEALLCFANSFDDHVAKQALDNQIQNQPNTIVVTPNRKAPDEKIILHGTTEELKPAITQTIAQYQLIHNRDLGYDLGQPLIERASKQISEYVIKLFLRSKGIAPGQKEAQRAEITINSANVLKFTDYDKVIRALGGGSDGQNIGYNYGNFLCIAQMDDGSTLRAYADSRDAVLVRIEALSELSTAKIQTMNMTEEIKDYQRRKIDGLAKNIVRIYPRKMEIVRKTKIYADYEKSFTSTGGLQPTKQGYYNETPYSLPLWQGHKPANWDEIISIVTMSIAPI
jgi:hypothetical protein